MFFFGLFSTHLPYILVGVIYFASFAFASLHALKAGVNDEREEERSVNIQGQAENSYHSGVYVLDNISKAFCESVQQDVPQIFPPEIQIIIFSGSAPVSSFREGKLFVRPPPTTS